MADKIEREISDEIGVFSSRKAPSKVKVALDDDLFGSPPRPSQKKDTTGKDQCIRVTSLVSVCSLGISSKA